MLPRVRSAFYIQNHIDTKVLFSLRLLVTNPDGMTSHTPRARQALSFDSFWMVLLGRTLIGLGGARGVNRRYIADTIPIESR